MKRVVVLVSLLCFLPAPALAAELININTANAALLDTLPGIGAVKAQAIIGYRIASGTFAVPADIQNVKGIGPATFSNIEPLITVVGGIDSLPPPLPKPSPSTTGSKKVQKVAPVTSKVSPPAYDAKAVVAPTTATKNVAAVGALVPASFSVMSALTSPWTLGFVGVVIFSGVALVVL